MSDEIVTTEAPQVPPHRSEAADRLCQARITVVVRGAPRPVPCRHHQGHQAQGSTVFAFHTGAYFDRGHERIVAWTDAEDATELPELGRLTPSSATEQLSLAILRATGLGAGAPTEPGLTSTTPPSSGGSSVSGEQRDAGEQPHSIAAMRARVTNSLSTDATRERRSPRGGSGLATGPTALLLSRFDSDGRTFPSWGHQVTCYDCRRFIGRREARRTLRVGPGLPLVHLCWVCCERDGHHL